MKLMTEAGFLMFCAKSTQLVYGLSFTSEVIA